MKYHFNISYLMLFLSIVMAAAIYLFLLVSVVNAQERATPFTRTPLPTSMNGTDLIDQIVMPTDDLAHENAVTETPEKVMRTPIVIVSPAPTEQARGPSFNQRPLIIPSFPHINVVPSHRRTHKGHGWGGRK